MGGVKPTKYDIIQDQEIAADDVFQQSGDIISPKAADAKLQVDAAAASPSTPPTDKVRIYATKSGVTPNKIIKVAHKTEAGEEIIHSTTIL